MKQTLLFIVFLSWTFSNVCAQNGLIAEYYNGTNFEEFIGTNRVGNIDLFWNRKAPIQGLDPHKCSVRIKGFITPKVTGPVIFTATGDDGFKVWIDDVLVISNWQLNDAGYSAGVANLIESTNHKIKIEYFNALNEAELKLLWSLPEDKDSSWFSSWWDGDEPVLISAEFFKPPKEKVVADTPVATAEPAPKPIAKPIAKPVAKPKTKVVSSPPPVQEETTAVLAITKPVNVYQQYIPKSVEFEQAHFKILSVSYAELDKLAVFLVENPNRKLKIEGHTDNAGDADLNLKLSEQRALAVASYLVKKGVNVKQIRSAEGFGGTKPIANDDDREYHPENRRVEFEIE